MRLDRAALRHEGGVEEVIGVTELTERASDVCLSKRKDRSEISIFLWLSARLPEQIILSI